MVTGDPELGQIENPRKVEYFDLDNPSSSCNIPDFPIELFYSTGGFTRYGPLLCSGMGFNSGREYTLKSGCYLLKQGRFQKVQSLNTARFAAASVITTNNDLWVIGGISGEIRDLHSLSSTELVSLGEDSRDKSKFDRLQPTLPTGLHHACIARISKEKAILIGGEKEDRQKKETYYLNLKDFIIYAGPTLNIARREAGCASFQSRGQTVTVVAGGYGREENGGHVEFDSVEYLADDGQWKIGKQQSHILQCL